MQKSGLAGQLLKIKDQYECLVKLIKNIESAKYTIKEAVQAIPELDFGEDTFLPIFDFVSAITLKYTIDISPKKPNLKFFINLFFPIVTV